MDNTFFLKIIIIIEEKETTIKMVNTYSYKLNTIHITNIKYFLKKKIELFSKKNFP